LKFGRVQVDCSEIDGPICLLVRGVSSIKDTLEAAKVPVDYAIFLKAYNVEREINEAERFWKFVSKITPRRARAFGKIAFLKGISKKR